MQIVKNPNAVGLNPPPPAVHKFLLDHSFDLHLDPTLWSLIDDSRPCSSGGMIKCKDGKQSVMPDYGSVAIYIRGDKGNNDPPFDCGGWLEYNKNTSRYSIRSTVLAQFLNVEAHSDTTYDILDLFVLANCITQVGTTNHGLLRMNWLKMYGYVEVKQVAGRKKGQEPRKQVVYSGGKSPRPSSLREMT